MGKFGTPQTLEERRLAWQVAAALWLTAGAALPLAMFVPEAGREHLGIVLAIAAVCIAWGLLCLRLPATAPAILLHLPAVAALVLSGVTVALTGGAQSPARLFLFFLVAWVGYFYTPRVGAPYLAACTGVHALPLLYSDGLEGGYFVGEVIVAMFSYVVLGAVIMTCKAQLVGERERAARLSLTDPLTELPNRRALGEELARHARGRRLGLMFIDLDNLKDANTRFGHPGGDRVLCAAAGAIRAAARKDDMVARLGGDEFAVVASDVDDRTMSVLASRVLESIRRAGLDLDLPDYVPRASAGWALHPDHAPTMEQLAAAADRALFSAKDAGKDRARPAVAPAAV